ncbi:MAG: radical SAM protein, partial [Candidatus Omnitrophota bacterium]
MNRKRILLVTINSDDYFPVQLALYYLKSYLQKTSISNLSSVGIDIFTHDEKLDVIVKRILDKQPEIIGFSCYVWNIEKILEVARLLKDRGHSLKIILGGPEVSPWSRSKELLEQEKSIDIIVRGEGEETFAELTESLFYQKIELSAIKGISYRTESSICINPARPLMDELDRIPSPYLEGLIDIKKEGTVPIETMRGCAYRCHYCYYHKDFKGLRYFSLDRVESEFKFILEKEPYEVYIMDPTFNADYRRAKEILRIFIRHSKGSKLHVELRAESLDKEMVELLYEANTGFIEIGIQSVNTKALKLVNRTLVKKMFKKNISLLNKKKIFYQIQLIDGLPGHSYADIKKSLDWLYSLHPSQVRIMKLMVLHGTYLRQNAKTLGIKFDSMPPYFVYKTETMTYKDLKRITKLRQAMKILYDRGLLRLSMYVLKKKLKINFSDIFEGWI